MIIKIAVLGVAMCIVIGIIKNFSVETVLTLELAFAVIVMIFLSDKIFDLTEKLRNIFSENETERVVLSALLKGAVVCLVTKISADIAVDSGNRMVADIIDFSGRIILLIIGFPFFESVITTAAAFLP